MMQKIKTFLPFLIIFTLVLFAIQYAIVEKLKHTLSFFYNTWSIYVFHFLATFLIYLFLVFVNKTFPDRTGFAFMSCSLLKMLAAVVFLLPLILNKQESYLNDIFAFFIPYFLFLILETVIIVKVLNEKNF